MILTLPAVALVLIFSLLLSAGNGVFGIWTRSFFVWLEQTLGQFLDFDRISLWALIAFLILPLLRPVQVSAWWWSWSQRLPRLPELVPANAAFFSSALVLLAMNGVFLMANYADAAFHWHDQPLPKGVTYSAYVHQGVEVLIVTVLLSAFVLAGLLQQVPAVTTRRVLRFLALGWIAQNLFLLVSVALRLKLYIEAYDLSVERLGVMLFLGLIAAGFVLLTIKIAYEKSLSWLLGSCLLAAFAMFYLVQFFDLAGWTANYNVAQWQKDQTRDLNFCYLETLGPGAWPALRRAHNADPLNSSITESLEEAAAGQPAKTSELRIHSWREFSGRAWLNRKALGLHE